MMGSDPSAPNAATNNAGLYVLAARDIFRRIKTPEFNTLSIYVSCFEIYGTKLYDLLNGRNAIKCLEDSKQQVQVLGLSEHNVGSVEDILDLMVSAHSQRSVGTTGANAESSRSHQILQIVLKENSKGKKMKEETRKLSFIDLAGSERGADTASSSKQTRQEGAEINTSLLALKEVIRSLEKKNGYTPFRGSKLTQVLKDSFIGAKTRTCMLACIAPSHSNAEHTLNTLRYADRVKENDPREPADMKSPVKSTEIPPSEKIAFALPEKEVSLQDLSTNLKKAEKHSKSKAPITSEANKSDSRRKSVGNNSVKPHAEESRNESNTLFVKAAAKPTPKSKSSSTDLRIVDVETSKSKSEVKNSAYIRQMLSLLSAHKLSIAEMVEVMTFTLLEPSNFVPSIYFFFFFFLFFFFF